RVFHVTGVQTCALPISRRARRLVGARTVVAALGTGGDGREVVELGTAQQCIGPVVAGQRDAQVVVGGQGLFDQRGQLRVAEALRSEERRVGRRGIGRGA